MGTEGAIALQASLILEDASNRDNLTYYQYNSHPGCENDRSGSLFTANLGSRLHSHTASWRPPKIIGIILPLLEEQRCPCIRERACLIRYIRGPSIDALRKFNVVLCDQVDEHTFDDLLNEKPARASMRAASPRQHGILQRGEMEFGCVAFFSHALPAPSVELLAIRMDVGVTT